MALADGAPAPDFTLPDQHGRPVHLAELRASGPVVVFFYPKNGTPGCTKEACAFRDAYESFVAAGYKVVGISADNAESHDAFRQKHGLPFALLTDADGRVAKAYGVKRSLFGLVAGRASFIVDRQGTVRHHFVALLDGEAHVTQALAAMRALDVR